MIKKLNIFLRLNSNEQGFAIPIALGLGLVMILVGTTMLVRSQGDQINGSLQKNTAQSLSIAEAGVTNVQRFLNKNRSFATINFPWSSYVSNTTGLNCSTSSSLYTDAAALDGWQTIGTGNDQFRVISYNYTVTNPAKNIGEGTLVVEGRSRQGTTVKSTTKLQIKIPVQRKLIPSFSPPGVWARSYSLGNNDFVTDTVIDGGCTSSISSAQEANNFSPATPGGTVNVIRDPSLILPSVQTVPTQCPPPASFTASNKPCAIYLSAPLSGNATFPRPIDILQAINGGYGTGGTGINGEYIYYIPKGGGTKSVNLGGSDQMIITPGTKVTFYLEGNFEAGGSSDIQHNCGALVGCSPTNFQIFGGENTTQILIRGNTTIDAFIFAPNAINSGVDGNGQIRGSMWIKGWNASSANHVMVTQTGGWNNVPQFMRPPNIDATNSWQRKVL